MKKWIALCVYAATAAVHVQASAQARLDEFAWRAALQMPAGASLVRVELPASALARVQSARLNDVRVFNAAGEAVPFSWVELPPQPSSPEQKTSPFRALPLYALPAGVRVPQGALQVHVGGSQPVWVRVDGAAAAALAPNARPIESVLFDTRDSKSKLSAIDLDATLPSNTPVGVAVSTSRDLAQWSAVPVRGRVYRFDGDRAPVNLRIDFEQPVELEGRYLRLDWRGQSGVTVASITGVLSHAAPRARTLQSPLTDWRQDGDNALETTTGFSTPLASIALVTPRENTLLPLRVLGRNEKSQPWVVLGQTVVYRLGGGGEAMTNPPLDLHGASVRQLRIASTNGAPLAAAQVSAQAEFTPRELVFVASGAPPFTLAAGRARTDVAALPAATLTGMLGAKKVEELPRALPGAPVEVPRSQEGWFGGALNRSMALWAVLLLGVALLGVVAWKLMRDVKAAPAGDPPGL